MSKVDTKINFHHRFGFTDAALVLWTTVRMDMKPSDLLEFLLGENLVLKCKTLSTEEKVLAFDFLANTNSLRKEVAAGLWAKAPDSKRDVFICLLVLSGILYGGLTKGEAISQAVIGYRKAKVRHHGDEELFPMFKAANVRQIENIWAKYRPVLHYAEVVALDWIGTEIQNYPALSNINLLPVTDLEKRSKTTLAALRSKGLVDAALIVGRDD